jgi:c-di-GMP-binding flagellar brake protein YcgR
VTVAHTGAHSPWAINGHLVGMTPESLEVAAGVAASVIEATQGAACVAQFSINNESYGFDCEVESARRSGTRLYLVISRPERAWVRQRRRFWRTTLRESTAITLTTPDGAASAHGAVLNVSVDGLACRVACKQAESLSIGDAVETRFTLDGDHKEFTLAGEIRGKTAAGSPDQVILRLQFTPASMTEDDRLRIGRAVRTDPERI